MDSREVVNKTLDVTSKIVDQAEGWLINQHNEITRLKAVNAELLAALEEIHDAKAPHKANGYADYKRLVHFMKGRASAAIAKVKP